MCHLRFNTVNDYAWTLLLWAHPEDRSEMIKVNCKRDFVKILVNDSSQRSMVVTLSLDDTVHVQGIIISKSGKQGK